MNKELKPCPFCGAEEIYRTYVKSHWVLCSRCGSVGGSGLDEAEAVKKWNARTYESELQSLRAEIVDLKNALYECEQGEK